MSKVTITDPQILARLVADRRPVYTDNILDICKEVARTNDASLIHEYIDEEVEKCRSEIVCGVLSVILKHPNPDLTVRCLTLATGSNLLAGDIPADVARQFNVSRSAVRQRIKLLRQELGIRDSSDE